MRGTAVAVLAFLLSVGPLALQAQTTTERLSSRSARSYVLLHSRGETFRYSIDTTEERSAEPLPGLLDIDLSDGVADIRMDFRSPFLYSLAVQDSATVDPVSRAVSAFITAAAALPAGAAPVVGAATADAEPGISGDQVTAVPSVTSSSLLVWSLFMQQPELRCVDNGRDGLIEAVNVADNALFGGDPKGARPTEVNDQGTFVRMVRSIVAGMARPYSDIQEFDAGLDSIGAGLKALKSAQQEAEQAIKAAEAALTAAGFKSDGRCPTFERLTEVSLAGFYREARAVMARRQAAVVALTELDSAASEVAKSLETAGERRLVTLDAPSDSVMHVTVTVTPIALTTGEDGLSVTRKAGAPKTIKVRAFERGGLIPEFTAGIAYTGVEYAQWGTKEDGGETIVVEAEPDRADVVPMVALNLVGAFWRGAVHPVAQLGLSASSDRPAFLLGGGLRISALGRTAVASVGGIWTWVPALNGLELGQAVTGTAALLDAMELEFRARPGIYVSLTIN